jgi:hypothetical protein
MALPTLTLTDPHNLDADMSLPMSPTIKSPDTFTSFEFERTSGRPGTASSVGDGAGKYVIIMIINPSCRCREKIVKALSFLSPNRFLVASKIVHVGCCAATSSKQALMQGWRMRMRTNRANRAELS